MKADLINSQVYCADLKVRNFLPDVSGIRLLTLLRQQLAHYMKVPPRVTFMCQVVATIWASIVQIAVMNWTLGNIDEVCTPYVMHILGKRTCY